MYKLARKGEKFERREQEIEITSLDLIKYDYPNFSIQVNCSKGTYVRTLGCDIAKMLGTTAVLSDLKRTRFGNLSIDDSISFDALKNLDNQAKMQYVKRVEEILINIPRINISSTEVNKFRNGSKVEPGELYPCSACPTKSTATISGSAFSSAIIPISVGPANKSIPTLPNKILLASATNWFPGPTNISAGAFPNKPFVIAAIA